MTRRASIPVLTLVLLTSAPGAWSQSTAGADARNRTEAQSDGFDLVDDSGQIRKPQNYRDGYQVLGAFMVLNPQGNEMHYTYASPGAAEYYRKNGQFADGTVLVKEVLAASHAQLTTGDAHWGTEPKVWFVMVKDAKRRFPGNPLWGDGWGWALFKADAPDKQVATNYRKDCLGCHIPARGTDWVYVQGYPVLASPTAGASSR